MYWNTVQGVGFGSWGVVSGLGFGDQALGAVRACTASPAPGGCFFFFFFTLVTCPRRSLSLKLSETRVYEPQIRARWVRTSIGIRNRV